MRRWFLLLLFIPILALAQDAETLERQGDLQFENGEFQKAHDSYSKVLDQNPENLTALLQRALTASILNDYESAVADYSVVLSKQPGHVFSYISRGSALNKLKRFDEAMADFDHALSIDSKNQEAFNNRGWAKNGLGRSQDACDDWKASKKLGNAEAAIILKNNRCR
ncbi:MAG: tetratricopeptide repeat protein [Flavobacteriales bacterium]|nr:tetratricopeptide repeat protein [Flavobacteriales bacterium]